MSRIFVFTSIILSFQLFATGTPTSPSAPAFVPNPSGRGTVGLILSCVVTLSLCVWSAIHMNLRPPRAGRWGRLKWKILWAGMAFVLPEVVVVIALEQLQYARSVRDQRNTIVRTANTSQRTVLPVQKQPEKEDGNGASAHEINIDEPIHTNCPLSDATGEQIDWTLTHSYFGLLGGFQLKTKRTSLGQDWKDKEANIINLRGLLRLAELKMLPGDIPKALIEARSKSDWLAKGLICFQVIWMMIQIIARKVDGLPVTLLELNTAAHIACAVLLYSIWWCKPQDVSVLIVVDISACEKCKRMLTAENFASRGLVAEVPNTMDSETLGIDFEALTDARLAVVLIALSAAYGGIHAAAWDAHFPSRPEQAVWRVTACLVIGAAALIWGAIIGFSRATEEWQRILMVCMASFAMPLFLFGRLYLLVEAFISVRSLPVGAYNTTDWVNFLPHIG